MAATRPAAETTEANVDLALGFHRGAIDQTTITTQPPSKVMKQMTAILRDMGVQIQEESTFRYRCIRPKKSEDEANPATDSSSIQSSNTKGAADSTEVSFSAMNGSGSERATQCECTLYGTASDDPADEVRFSLEVTKLSGLSGTYSLDIRRLKGNLKSYKYIYDTIRE
ncbi:hypothetical protein GALMADRAFT_71590 [Galerina marginata CBS 339.88]|uniref:non-specific serine/threonine protein kinase n=1 Tax=Galerina marginata (strain CBS 339.88) TaxID=685588 RepID=A0A067SVD6_GALM3|nr:hypothetical protein GALMADRAFT_71590 [Galerina marginata CBS 339.88]